MDEAVELYRELGFCLTPRGRHSLGSINHLAVFGDSYLELIGYEPGAETVRPEILAAPIGFNALVLASADADATRDALLQRGVAADPPLDFSRPVEIAGVPREARFRTVRPAGDAPPFGRLYFCQHLTRELVWREEWQAHGNAAASISRAVISSSEPRVSARYFARLFGAGAVRPMAGGYEVALANARVEIVEADLLQKRYGDAMPDQAGRSDYLAVLGLVAGNSRVVPACAAINVCLEFTID
jgi:hypothetical protein